jgi:ATP-dependent HslUV protease ATP-binding subunit HslU
MENLTPRAIVAELDKYIVGQNQAKRMVAVALRNRYRRQLLPPEMKDEIIPKNILMIGPTGVGKTEIARRLAKMVNAPFIKVEATKFTEVGYVGRDVESIVRDIVEMAVRMVKAAKTEGLEAKVQGLVIDRIVDIMAPLPSKDTTSKNPFAMLFGSDEQAEAPEDDAAEKNRIHDLMQRRRDLKIALSSNAMDHEPVEIEVETSSQPTIEFLPGSGMEEMGINLQDIFGGLFPKKKKKKKLTISEAKRIITIEEIQKLVDMDEVIHEAIDMVEQTGIVFLDEMDKIAGSQGGSGPDVSREGVQRDILPIVEGSTVMTKYGPVRTDYMLFIAAGAFHVSKPSDLIPELQGRFPIRVELQSLSKSDFKRILTEPENALIKQYIALMYSEGISLVFAEDAVDEIASIACQVNEESDNIGARRLYTIMEKLLEDLSFAAPEIGAQEVIITKEYVIEKLAGIVKNRDLSRYIL